MAREVELCEYLPEVIKTNREFQTLCCSQTPQVNALWKNLDIVFENQFIESLTEYGCQRWESIIGIVAQKEDTLEIRRKRIWIRLNENLPYTWKRLHQLMGVLCGEDGYQMTLYHLEYFIDMEVFSKPEKGWENIFQEVKEMLSRVLPANMGYQAAFVSPPIHSNLLLGGAVFSSIVETVLPEIEQYYDFVIPMNVACGCWTVMDTVLTELESD